MNTRRNNGTRGSYPDRNRRTSKPNGAPTNSPADAKGHYERYVALARASGVSGNTIDSENYYQHAEHYFRMMKAVDA